MESSSIMTKNTTIAQLPFELIEDIAIHLHPHYINRLSRASTRLYHHLSSPNYSFAKRDIIKLLSTSSQNNENYIFSLKDLFDTIGANEVYWAAFIGLIGVKTTAKWMLDIEVRSMEWFEPNEVPDGVLFCDALSMAAVSGDLNLMDDDYNALLLFTAAGDLGTLVYLQDAKMLQVEFSLRAVCRGQMAIVHWVLSLMSLEDYESLGINRKVVLDVAIETGDLNFIKLFYNAKEDFANEAIVNLHRSGHISRIEILDFFLGMDNADPVTIFQEKNHNFGMQTIYKGSTSLSRPSHSKGFPTTSSCCAVQPFSTDTNFPAFTKCLNKAAEAGQTEVMQYLLVTKEFDQHLYHCAMRKAVENNRAGVFEVLLNCGKIRKIQSTYLGRHLGAIVRLLVESGIMDKSMSDWISLDLCPFSLKFSELEDYDEVSDWTESETSCGFPVNEDGAEDDEACGMDVDKYVQMDVEMEDDLFDSMGIRKWEFNESSTSQP
ncbi:hypothetical protein HDU76_006867 [Blyttiomyces sp. JEL0837]|nr:hypothetical protein HDU76_006867 [Blyttiomyces sp. JEL0837]